MDRKANPIRTGMARTLRWGMLAGGIAVLGGGCARTAGSALKDTRQAAPRVEAVRSTSETAAPLAAEPRIRVLIIETLAEAEATPTGAWTLTRTGGGAPVALEPATAYTWRVVEAGVALEREGHVLATAPAFDLAPAEEGALLHIQGVPYGIGWWWESLQDRAYPGHFHVRANAKGKLDVIVTLDVEEYLLGVVPQEIGPDSPLEALKAQAVAARTETWVALRTGKYAGEGYDICADVACQAYSGTARYSDATARAVAETLGLVLHYQGEPFGAFYASNCGGHSEHIENVWPARSGPRPFWKGIPDFPDADGPAFALDLSTEEGIAAWIDSSPDVCCNPAFSPGLPAWSVNNFRWTREFTAEEMAAAAATVRDIGRVLRIEAVKRGVSGRLIEARFVGERGEFTRGPELAIRQVVHPPLRSAAFVVETQGPADAPPEKFVIRGAGWGHGVGMCQTGAIARANAGVGFRDILAHYYQGSGVMAVYE